MYQRLIAYKKEHNDTNVPCLYTEDPKLGYWLNKQCTRYKTEKMTEERKSQLNSIGFVWDGKAPGTSTATWEEMYERLLLYKIEHNDTTSVPQHYKEDPKFGTWVHNQCAAYRGGK